MRFLAPLFLWMKYYHITKNKDIYKGDIFTENNLTTKRPGNGKSPILWKNIIGKVAKNNYEKDEKI
jgi:N,N'-diacetyllegionaminate synthase